MSTLGRSIYVSRAAGANQITTIRGKPAPRGNRAVQGSWIIGDPTRPSSRRVAMDVVDLEGNEAALLDIQKAWGASQIGIADAGGNALTPTQLIGLLEGQMMPPTVGPFQWAGAVAAGYLAGAAADGIKAKETFTLLEAEATAKVANTVGDNVLTVTNLTTTLACTFTFTAGAALFKRATASAQLQIRKGDKYSIAWSAAGGTPGSDVSVLLKTIEGA